VLPPFFFRTRDTGSPPDSGPFFCHPWSSLPSNLMKESPHLSLPDLRSRPSSHWPGERPFPSCRMEECPIVFPPGPAGGPPRFRGKSAFLFSIHRRSDFPAFSFQSLGWKKDRLIFFFFSSLLHNSFFFLPRTSLGAFSDVVK